MRTALALAALCTAPLAWAGPCETGVDGGLDVGFSTVNPRPGDLGSGHRLCGRTEVGFSLGGSATLDIDNLYGLLGGGLTVDGALTLTDRTTLFGSLELLRYDTLISAFSDSALGPGHTMVGVGHRLAESETAALGVDGRLVLPTAVALYRNAWPLALDAGLSAEWAPVPAFRGHARLGLLTSAALSTGPAYPWLGGTARIGGEWRPGRAFGLLLDVDTTLGYAAEDVLEGIVLAPAFRFGVKQTGIAMGFWVPVVTDKRQPLAFELRVATRFE